MATILHGKKETPFYFHKGFIESISVVPPIAAAVISAILAYRKPESEAFAPWLVGAAAWLGVTSIVKILYATYQETQEKAKQGHDGLYAALHVMHATVARVSKIPVDDGKALRITVHRVVEPLDDPRELEQLLPYVGGPGGPAERRFSITMGIAGLVARTGEPHVFASADNNSQTYLKALIDRWGYTEAAVKQLTRDRLAAFAAPIISSERKTIGVVYFDSSNKDFFTSDVIQAILGSCDGITRYIGERYTS